MAKFLEKHFKRKNISRPSLQTSQNLNVMLYRLLIWTQRKRNESPKRAKTHTWVQKRPFISFRNNCFTAAEGNVIASHTAPTPKRLLIYQYSKDQTLLSDISCSHPGAIKRMGLPSRGEEGWSLFQKGVAVRFSPCQDQFISKLFLVANKNGSSDLQWAWTALFKSYISRWRDQDQEEGWMCTLDLKMHIYQWQVFKITESTKVSFGTGE